MKKLILLLIITVLLVTGCGNTQQDEKVKDDMTVDEAVKYAKNLFKENVADSANSEELLDNMIDDAVNDLGNTSVDIAMSDLKDISDKTIVAEYTTDVNKALDTFDGITYSASNWSVTTHAYNYLDGERLELNTFSLRNMIRNQGSKTNEYNSDYVDIRVKFDQIIAPYVDVEPIWNDTTSAIKYKVIPDEFKMAKSYDIDLPICVESLYNAGFYFQLKEDKVLVFHNDAKDSPTRAFALVYSNNICSDFDEGHIFTLEEAVNNFKIMYSHLSNFEEYKTGSIEDVLSLFGMPDYRAVYTPNTKYLGYELKDAYLICKDSSDFWFLPKTDGMLTFMKYFFCEEEEEEEVIALRAKITNIYVTEDNRTICKVDLANGKAWNGDTVVLLTKDGEKIETSIRAIYEVDSTGSNIVPIDSTMSSTDSDSKEFYFELEDRFSLEEMEKVCRIMSYGEYDFPDLKEQIEESLQKAEEKAYEESKELVVDENGERVPIDFKINDVHQLSSGDVVISGELKEGTLSKGDFITITHKDGSEDIVIVDSLDEGTNIDVEIALPGNKVGIHIVGVEDKNMLNDIVEIRLGAKLPF